MAVFGGPAMCRGNDGRLWEALCLNGKVNVRHQQNVGGTFTSWLNIQGAAPAGDLDSVAIACNNDGRIEVHAISTVAGFGGVLYGAWQTTAGLTQPFTSFVPV